MEDARFVEILFENCESIIIPMERVDVSGCDNLRPYEDVPFERKNVYEADRLTMRIAYASEDELIYQADEEKEPLGMFVGNPTSNRVSDRPHILGRILCHEDIIGFDYLDANEERLLTVYLPWGKEEYVNACMLTDVTPTHLLLTFTEEPSDG